LGRFSTRVRAGEVGEAWQGGEIPLKFSDGIMYQDGLAEFAAKFVLYIRL